MRIGRRAVRRTAVLAVVAGAFLSGVQLEWAAGQTGSISLQPAPSSPFTLDGDYSAAGTGLRATGSGNIRIVTPVGATVEKAFLYWSILGGDAPLSTFDDGRFNGTLISGTLIGSDVTPCWDGTTMAYNYRADVTGLVASPSPGAQTYVLTEFGMPVVGEALPLPDGASLMIVYRFGSATRSVTIYEGAVTIGDIPRTPGGTPNNEAVTTMSVPTIGDIDMAHRATTTYIVGDGQVDGTDQTFFNGVRKDLDDNGFEGSDGALFDTDTYDVSAQVMPGEKSVTVKIAREELIGDCLVHVAQVFSAPKGTDAGGQMMEPAVLTIMPTTAVVTVGQQHTVTATVMTTTGQPVSGVLVEFSVTGAVNTAGTCTTLANGQCSFSFVGPPFPGAVTITAQADINKNGMTDAGEIAVATAEFVLPANTPNCEVKITYGGWIIAKNGDRGNFGGNAKTDALGRILIVSGVTGEEEYQDQGPFQPLNLHGQPVALVCDAGRKSATIFGQGTINGAGLFWFRIKVTDAGEPGTNDTYGILISNLYYSGEKCLSGGNIQIH